MKLVEVIIVILVLCFAGAVIRLVCAGRDCVEGLDASGCPSTDLAAQVGALDQKLTTLQSQLTSLTSQVNDNTATINAAKDNLSQMQSGLDSLDADTSDMEATAGGTSTGGNTDGSTS